MGEVMNRRIVSVGAASATALILALAAAPAAHADESMFLQQAQAQEPITYMGASTSQLLKLGYLACDVMRSHIKSGTSMAVARSWADKAVGQAASAFGLQTNRAGVMLLTGEAEDNLC